MKFKDFLNEAAMKKPKTVEEVYAWLARNDTFCKNSSDPLAYIKKIFVVDPKTLVVTMVPAAYSDHPDHEEYKTGRLIPTFNNDTDDQDYYTTLPVKFGKLNTMHFNKNKVTSLKNFPPMVERYFTMADNPITSLVGCPKEVGNFHLTRLPITRLDAMPKKIHNDCYIRECNNLTSLAGMEKTDCEGIELLLEDCRGITNLEHIPENIESLALHKMTIEDLSGLHKKIPKIKVISFWDKTVVKHSILSLLKFDDLYISYHNIDPSFAKALEIVQKHQANKSIPDCMDELIEAGLKEYAKL